MSVSAGEGCLPERWVRSRYIERVDVDVCTLRTEIIDAHPLRVV